MVMVMTAATAVSHCSSHSHSSNSSTCSSHTSSHTTTTTNTTTTSGLVVGVAVVTVVGCVDQQSEPTLTSIDSYVRRPKPHDYQCLLTPVNAATHRETDRQAGRLYQTQRYVQRGDCQRR